MVAETTSGVFMAQRRPGHELGQLGGRQGAVRRVARQRRGRSAPQRRERDRDGENGNERRAQAGHGQARHAPYHSRPSSDARWRRRRIQRCQHPVQEPFGQPSGRTSGQLLAKVGVDRRKPGRSSRLLRQRRLEGRAGAVESGLDRSLGRPEDRRDLGDRSLLKVMQDEHGAVVDRQAGEGSIEGVGVGSSVVQRLVRSRPAHGRLRARAVEARARSFDPGGEAAPGRRSG